MKELNKEQQKVIEANIIEQIIVNASPGTGKTYTVAKKLEYIIKNKIVLPKDILVICFSRSALKEIKNRIEMEEEIKSQIEIRTIDSFCSWAMKQIEEENYKEIFNNTTYDERIEYTIELLKSNERLQNAIKSLKHIIIDEVQDIVRDKSRICTTIIEIMPFWFYIIRR